MYSPGVYNYPVVVTTAATFADCGGGIPGIYIFNRGVEVCPQASGQSVTGSNIMFYSSQRFSDPNGCPGAGKGQDGDNDYDNTPDYLVRPPRFTTPFSPTGDLYSTDGDQPNDLDLGIFLGGVTGTSVTLSAPTSGPYLGMMTFQDRRTPANLGLDSTNASDATIDITGTLYDISTDVEADHRMQMSLVCDFSPTQYGGRLIAGWRPCASSTGGTTADVTIHGGAVVDVFDSPGDGTLLVDGAGGSGAPRLIQ